MEKFGAVAAECYHNADPAKVVRTSVPDTTPTPSISRIHMQATGALLAVHPYVQPSYSPEMECRLDATEEASTLTTTTDRGILPGICSGKTRPA
jgi:hypothetical protein